jgi:hypothetical protein
MQPFEASLISNLVSIIQDSQEEVFRSYRETQNIGDDVTEVQMPPNSGLNIGEGSILVSVASPSPFRNSDGRNSTSNPRPLDQYVNLPSNNNFIDTIFSPPPPVTQLSESQSLLPTMSLTRDDLTGNLANFPKLSSDSGYSSEQQLQLYKCSGLCNPSCNYGSPQSRHLQDGLDLNLDLDVDSMRELEVGDDDLHWNG